MFSNVQSLVYFIPEMLLSASALALMFLSLARESISKRYAPWFMIAGLAACYIALTPCVNLAHLKLFSGLFIADKFSFFFKVIFLAAASAVVVFSAYSKELGRDTSEYFALLTGLVLGMILLTSTINILMIYLSLEFVGLMSYLLVGYAKDKSKEASIKYVLYGAVASGVFLYGASLYYGITGTLEISTQALPSSPSHTFTLASLFMLAGFLFKIAAVPMHAWCPDAYEGAPTPITAFLSVAPKAAGFAVLMRVAMVMGGKAGWPYVIAVISAATMTFGNLAAIPQKNLKRLLAYSSIAHAGYILMGVASATPKGNEAVYFYLIAYLIMNLGAFLVIQIIADGIGSEDIEAYRGLGRRGLFGALTAICMVIFLLSLTGIPPFVGFIGKFYIFTAVLDAKLYWLAILGILNSVISLYYYMRIVREMFLASTGTLENFELCGRPLLILMLLLAALTLMVGLSPQIVDLSQLHL